MSSKFLSSCNLYPDEMVNPDADNNHVNEESEKSSSSEAAAPSLILTLKLHRTSGKKGNQRDYVVDPVSNETSAMRKHLTKCKKMPKGANMDFNQTELTFKVKEDGSGAVGTWKFSQEAIRDTIVDMVITEEIPFNFVSSKGFKKVLVVACPRFVMPSRQTVGRNSVKRFEEEKEMEGSIGRIEESVKYIRNSNARLAKFMALAKKEGINPRLGLRGDVCTRWNSTYLMLERAIAFEKVFQQYGYEDSKFRDDLEANGGGVPSANDWDKAKKLCKVFKKFYNLTNKVSGTSYATSNTMLQDICSIMSNLKELEKYPSEDVSGMALRMRIKFDKCTMANLNKSRPWLPKSKKHLLSFLRSIESFLQPGNTPQNQVANEATTSSNVAGGGMGLDDDDVMNEFRVFKMKSGKEENLTELDKYLK
ncbi:hypothetical protein CCACVL1_30025 [Corchorus capsularis]|uniref:Uncharacterized protein n=1 Tax=Corchorus capsularis TaxID=210143 RepID=A0A1R3FZ55_COCAP|nr:hypothetical protein CCACVL1_30025 [Corchorus capsularis]